MLLPNQNRISCMRVETGTKIFAVINVSLTALCTLASLAGFIYFSTIMILEFNSPTRHQDTHFGPMILVAGVVGTMVLLMLSLVALVFAIFLVNGSFKNKPEHIKAYFVYGVIVDTICLFSVVTFYGLTGFGVNFLIFTSMCIIYSLILTMIKKTYMKKEEAINQYSPQILINSEKC